MDFGSLADLILRREVVITMAILGAALAVGGPLLVQGDEPRRRATARWLVRLGYGVTFLSILLFIAAGFLGKS